jgi:hypothetical protein
MDEINYRLRILNILFGLFLISLISVFVVYFFSDYGYESWQVSEFLINYQGGFVRRGLLGEILFFFIRHTHFDVEWTVKIISAICCIGVCLFFVKSFLKRGYTLYLLPLCFFCSGPLMYNAWLKKDYLMVGIFIIILLIYAKDTLPLFVKILLINILAIFTVLTHEVFGFFALPALFFLFINWFKKKSIFSSIGLSMIALIPSVLGFLSILYNHGDQATAQAVWDSWFILSGRETTAVPMNSVGYLGCPIGTVWTHLKDYIFGVKDNYILAIWYWMIVFPVVYYITTNALLVFKKRPEVYTEKHRTILSSIYIFQLLCLSPVFIFFSMDYIRNFFYLTTSTFALFMIVPMDTLERLLPSILTKFAGKINAWFDLILPPSKSSMAVLMLTVGISFSSFSFRTVVMSTMVYRILLLFSEPTIMLKNLLFTLFQ